MKIFQTGYEGTTFVSRRDPKLPPTEETILTVCRYLTVSAVSIVAIVATGKWAVMAIAGIAFIGMLVREAG